MWSGGFKVFVFKVLVKRVVFVIKFEVRMVKVVVRG